MTDQASAPIPFPPIIPIDGELDICGGPAVARAVAAADPAAATVVLDLSRVTFMDSEGLKQLLVARQALAQRGSLLVLRHPSASVLFVLRLSGVLELFAVEPSVDPADPAGPGRVGN